MLPKWISFIAAAVCVLGLAVGVDAKGKPARAKPAETEAERLIREQTVTTYLVVLGTSKDFHALRAQAKQIARKASLPYSDDERVWDRKHGWGYWKGEDRYIMRRFNWTELPNGKWLDNYASVEMSEFYPGLRAGKYVIIGGILDLPEAKKMLARYKRLVPDAYLVKTKVYVGCTS